MKNIRSQSFNWAFVTLAFSVILTTICNFYTKNLNTTHLIPIEWNDHTQKFVFWEMPVFSIWYLIPLLTLLVFGIRYYHLSFFKDKKDFITGIITSIIMGITAGILSSVLDTPTPFLLIMPAIVLLFLPNIIGVCATAIVWVIRAVICILFHTSYGVIEHFGIIIMLVVFFLCINIIIISMGQFIRALIERVVLLAKSKEIKGIQVEEVT